MRHANYSFVYEILENNYEIYEYYPFDYQFLENIYEI